MSNKKNNNDDSLKQFDKIIENTFEKLRDIVDSNISIGKIIEVNKNIFIIPISKISVGLVSGGGEMPSNKKQIGVSVGSTTGFSVTPIGFVVVNQNGTTDYISAISTDNSSNKIFEILLNLIEKFTNKQEDNGYEKN